MHSNDSQSVYQTIAETVNQDPKKLSTVYFKHFDCELQQKMMS